MTHPLDPLEFHLRRPDVRDLEALYRQKNDPEIAALLGGFHNGYSRADLRDWVEFHRCRTDEVLWIVADSQHDRCVGHVGLYKIDHRVRRAEFAILLGERSVWGQGLGEACTRFAMRYAFAQLNLNRLYLSVLETNRRAQSLYEKLGFQLEGRLRQECYQDGRYVDLLLMAILRNEYMPHERT